MLKKITMQFIFFVLSICLLNNVYADTTKTPYEIIKETSTKLFDDLKNNQEELKTNPNKIKEIIKNDLMPYVDIKYASFKVMGASIRDTNEQQRNRFVSAFTTYIIDTYSSALAKYNTDQTIEIDPKTQGDEKNTIVNVKITTQDSQTFNVMFKLRQNNKTKEWKVFDLVAEGISLLSSKQAEFSNIINQKGIDEVCRLLEEHKLKSEQKL